MGLLVPRHIGAEEEGGAEQHRVLLEAAMPVPPLNLGVPDQLGESWRQVQVFGKYQGHGSPLCAGQASTKLPRRGRQQLGGASAAHVVSATRDMQSRVVSYGAMRCDAMRCSPRATGHWQCKMIQARVSREASRGGRDDGGTSGGPTLTASTLLAHYIR